MTDVTPTWGWDSRCRQGGAGGDTALRGPPSGPDRAGGFRRGGVGRRVGGTSVGASERVRQTIDVAREHVLYVHVDAAWAGSAMVCPELRGLWEGVEGADSIVFNPHKWLGAQFDCSIQFLADPEPQVRTLGTRPDYLQTLGQSAVTNYSASWIPLCRRFRALKPWFLSRAHGLEDLRRRIRNHISWAEEAAAARAEQRHRLLVGGVEGPRREVLHELSRGNEEQARDRERRHSGVPAPAGDHGVQINAFHSFGSAKRGSCTMPAASSLTSMYRITSEVRRVGNECRSRCWPYH